MVLNCQNYRPFYKDMYTTRMMKVLIKYSDKSLKLLQVWWKWPDARWLSVKLTSIFTTSVQPMVLESSLILLSKLYGHPNFVINDTRPVFNIFCYNCSRISVCSGFRLPLLAFGKGFWTMFESFSVIRISIKSCAAYVYNWV